MEVTTPDTTPGPPAAYARKATGLVRELPLFDMLTFTAAGQLPVALTVPISLAFASLAFPGANVLVAVIVALLLGALIWITYALLSATMPKTGGDYVYVSRALHPAIGFASNLAVFASTAMAVAYSAWAFVQVGLSPTFGIVGTVTGSDWWVTASADLLRDGWTLGIGAVLILAIATLAAFGTKLTVRTMTVLYLVSFVGIIVTLVVLLVTSNEKFISTLNDFSLPFTDSRDTYGDTVSAGAEAGLRYPSEDGYSFESTIGAIFTASSVTWAALWGVFLAGEMRGAGRRNRQLTMAFGAGWGQGLLLIVLIAAFYGTVGQDFFIAANAGNYGVEVSPYANYFSSIIVGNDVVAVLLGVAFLAAFPPWAYCNFAMCQRAPFAWAFDGLIPRRAADVNPRTHTPIVSIAVVAVLSVGLTVWATLATSFLTFLTYLILFLYVAFVIVGITAVVLPRRHPELYRGTPADWKLLGLPVLPVAGAGCALAGLFAIGLGIHFHTELGVEHARSEIIAVAAVLLAGVAYYYLARRVQRSRGVDLDLVYKTIPPD